MEDVMRSVLNQKNMRPYLEEKMLPDLRLSIKELLSQIMANKELDRHWQSKERENLRMMKATRRADRDRKRLEMGSNYCSDEENKFDCEESDSEEESDSYYDSECSEEEDCVMERDSELEDIIGTVETNEGIQAQRQPASALGSINALDNELLSKSALDGPNGIRVSRDVNSNTKQMNMNMGDTKRTRSYRSNKSRASLSHQFNFNPLRFLAMGLIEKN